MQQSVLVAGLPDCDIFYLDAADVRHFLFIGGDVIGGDGTGSNTVDPHAEEQRQVYRSLSAQPHQLYPES